MKAKEGFYAVGVGHQPGVYRTWKEAEAQVSKFPGAVFKKFESRLEAEKFVDATRKRKRESGEEDSQPTAKLQRIAWLESHLSETCQAPPIIIFTDGACVTPGTGYAKAGFGVFFEEGSPLNVSAPVPRNELQTCNRGELYGAITALEIMNSASVQRNAPPLLMNAASRPTIIYSDSTYVVQGITVWIERWRANGFMTAKKEPCKNEDLWKRLDMEVERRRKLFARCVTEESRMKRLEIAVAEATEIARCKAVSFFHVPGHMGCPGNEAADRLALDGATTASVT